MLLRIFTLVALAALAFGTWILSQPGRFVDEKNDSNRRIVPGYYLKSAVMTEYDDQGAASIKIAAERIEQVRDSSEVQLFNVRLDYLTPTGQAWILVGDSAHIQPGGQVVDVSGNVQLQGLEEGRTGPAVIRTDMLSYDINSEEVRTQSEVRLEFGRQTLLAHGLFARLKERTMRLESRVNGRFIP